MKCEVRIWEVLTEFTINSFLPYHPILCAEWVPFCFIFTTIEQLKVTISCDKTLWLHITKNQ